MLLCIATALLAGCKIVIPGGQTSGGDSGETGVSGDETGGGSGGSSDSEDEREDESQNGETFYYGGSEIMFITSGDYSSRLAAENIITALKESILDTGRAFLGNIYLDVDFSKEVVVGYVPEREISVKAYELLDEIATDPDKNESRYVIYADSGKICIAYEENVRSSFQPIEKLVSEFIEEYIAGRDQLLLEQGVVKSGAYDVDVLQAEADLKYTNEKWAHIASLINNDEVTASLRDFFENMYDKRLVTLIGSWYDPATGLFYASTSGKRAEGIYPIPEATNQALTFLTSVLDIPQSLYSYFPDIVGYKIVYYVKSIQASDGEFYVSQMKKSSIDSNRLGRDRSACITLLSRFGAQPTYTVGSSRGDGITAEQYWQGLVDEGLVTEEDKPIIYWGDSDPSIRVSSLSESMVVAVSRAVGASDVVAAASTSQFQSHEAFVKWLLAKDGYNNPYTAMSNTSSAAGIISTWSTRLGGYKGANKTVTYGGRSYELKTGETLNNILINWMNSYINEAGLFGKVTNSYVKDADGEYDLVDGKYVLAEDGDGDYSPKYDGFFGGWGYQNSNGFLKAIGRYGSMGLAYPKPREAAESLLKGIASDETIGGNILVIYNVWSSLGSLRSNIKSLYKGEDKQEILDMIEDTLWGKVTDRRTGETRTYAALAIDKCLAKLMAFKKVDGGFGHSISAGTASWQGGLKVAIPSDNLSDMDAISCTTNGLGSSICSALGISMSNVPLFMQGDLTALLDVMNAQPYVTKTPPVKPKPTDPAPKMESFDALSDWFVFGMGGGSTYELKEKDGDQALYVKKKIGFTSFTYTGIGIKEETPTVTVIGLDLLIENLTEVSGIEIYPQCDGVSVFLPYLAITGTSNGSSLTVHDHSSGAKDIASGIKVGEWASLQIRYYEREQKYDFYVNGSYVMSGNYLRKVDSYPTAEELNGVMVAMNNGNAGDFYFDNLYISQLKQ